MTITGTHFNYYQICRRKLWLFGNGINMEHTSDLVYEGKLVHEDSYPQRSAKYEEVAQGQRNGQQGHAQMQEYVYPRNGVLHLQPSAGLHILISRKEILKEASGGHRAEQESAQ